MDMERRIPVTGIENARELGGYPVQDGRHVRKHVLLRTANLYDATQQDIDLLVHTYHLKTVLDFRGPEEVSAKPFRNMEGIQRHWLNVMPDMQGSSSKAVAHSNDDIDSVLTFLKSLKDFEEYTMYIAILSSFKGQQAYTRFFQYLLENDRDHAVLWHCNAGKDRTGIAAMLILSVLGADRDLILQDYLSTNDYRKGKIEDLTRRASEKTDNPLLLNRIQAMYGVRRELLENLMQYCISQSGSVVHYTKEHLGLTEEKIERLKQLYLE